MIEFMEKIKTLKKELDQSALIKDLRRVQTEIFNDKELYGEIAKKNLASLQSSKVLEYKKLENEVNFLILEINQYLKEHLMKEGVSYEGD